MSSKLTRDWFEGDDPGMNLWHVVGADQTALVPGDVTAYSIAQYDLTARPTTLVLTVTTTTPALTVYATAQLDGYWTKDDIGYNVRHYLKVSDWSSLLPGHTYRWVYTLTTDAFNEGTGNWGKITMIREGTCKARGGLT